MQHSDTLLEQIGGDATLQSGISFSKKPKETKEKPKFWSKTPTQFLVRHCQSEVYYARTWAGGKGVWKSLGTTHYSIAKERLKKHLSGLKPAGQPVGGDNVSPKMTFVEAARIHLGKLDDNVDLKPRTKAYWRECLRALEKSWPWLNQTELRKITLDDCEEWASAFKKKVSPTRFNNTLAILRHVLSVGIKKGVIFSNPAAEVERRPARYKQIALPSTEKFNAMVAKMRSGHGRFSRDCADLAEGLAFTGCRIGEAREVEWRDLDFNKGEVVVRGDRETGTKNWELRRVPMIPDARALFERMRAERPDESLATKVFRVRECQKAIDRACRKVGADRITHHDLRHLFATRCIESGVDIPTVSRWLGHKDGGALLMKTYGHLRREHSRAQALKVSFAATPKSASVVPFSVEA